MTLTIGIQVNDSTAYQYTRAPLTSSFNTNGATVNDASDNVYHEFIPGSRPVNDAELVSLGLNPTEISPVTVTGIIKNSGTDTLKSVVVYWRVRGNSTVNRDTLSLSLPPQFASNFSHGINLVAIAGQFYDIEVWTSIPNGFVDGDNLNDSLKGQVFIMTGNTVQRNTIIEHFTTTLCRFCPDGDLLADHLNNNVQNIYATSIHSCFFTDSMTNTEATDLCSVFGINTAPVAMVNRKLFN